MNIRPIQPAFNGFIQTYYDEGHGHLKPITFNTNSINFEPLDTGYYSSDLTKVSSQLQKLAKEQASQKQILKDLIFRHK